MTAREEKRADARVNRERILDAAREALTVDSEASFNSIAKAAGVGHGTLYRHFPNREVLVLAVYRKEIDALVALAPTLLSEHPPLHAFRLWCGCMAQAGRVKHGIADMLHAAMSEQDIHETYWPMLGAVRQLIEACKHAGAISPAADAEDALTFLSVLGRIPPTPAGEARIDRLLGIFFRGLGAEDSKSKLRDAIPPRR